MEGHRSEETVQKGCVWEQHILRGLTEWKRLQLQLPADPQSTTSGCCATPCHQGALPRACRELRLLLRVEQEWASEMSRVTEGKTRRRLWLMSMLSHGQSC